MKIEMQNISKSFFGALALDGVDFSIYPAEIHALLGENGAGKSTLMNVLYGLYGMDSGTISIDDRSAQIMSPKDALDHGIGMVHQHFQLVDTLTVADNITLGLRENGYPFSKKKDIRARILSLSDKYQLSINPDKKIRDLSVGERQLVEIMKLLYREANVFILDEPTAVLSPPEIESFFVVLRQLKKAGHSIVIITHKINEVQQISDRVTVLRDGKRVLTGLLNDVTELDLSQAMIGRQLHPRVKSWRTHDRSNPRLVIEDVVMVKDRINVLNNLSIDLAPGEIVGIAGVDGNGQQELAEAIMGIHPISSGSISLDGENVLTYGITDRLDKGMGYIPSDRHHDAILLPMDLRQNLLLRKHHDKRFLKHRLINEKHATSETKKLISEFNIKTPSERFPIRYLSGGNQQKFVLARELSDDLVMLVAFQPSRGLDMGATDFIQNELLNLSKRGTSILLISTDLQEVISLSDRIAVIYKGEIMGILENDEQLDINAIGAMMGGKKV